MKTAELKQLIESRLEDEATPKRVLAWAEANQDKAIRSNNVPEGFELERQYGMSHLITPDYRQNGGRKGSSYLLAHTEKGAVVPTPERLKELASCYYAGVDERNAKRRAILADTDGMDKTAKAITKAEKALKAYQIAFDELEGEIGSGLDFPEWYTIEKEVNLCEFKNEYGRNLKKPTETKAD